MARSAPDAAVDTPLIKTRHTAETLALALERQRRWVERHGGTTAPPDKLRMAKADSKRSSS